jgi:uncharacterized protein (DUF1800 family)
MHPMTSRLDQIDPDWAWSPFVPEAETPWTLPLAAHLFRRAGFAASRAELNAALVRSPTEVVHDLCRAGEPPEFTRESTELAAGALASGDSGNLPAWWLHRLLTTPCPLREKATLFWHGHFATSVERVESPRLMLAQNELLRRHALGNFGALVQEISRDPAMLLWLDSASNRKAHPNENYARELMELFCLGEGEYSEQDIRELARCFTGWEIKAERFRFNRFQHDSGEKTILGRRGAFGGEEGAGIILEQPACPRFLVRRLMGFFLFDEPDPPASLVEPLARELRESGLEIGPLVERMLSSRLFFSPLVVGRKVRSPVELGVGLLRALDGSTNVYLLAEGLGEIGQRLFAPPSVKGWDGGRAWINSATLLGRANLVRRLLDHDATRFGRSSLVDYLDRLGVQRGVEVAALYEELLLARPLPPEVRRRIERQIDAAPAAGREAALKGALHLLATQPEFQLS